MDIVGSISAVSAALGLVKELRAIDAQFDKAELKLKIAELTEALSDAKLGLIDVAEELKAKDGLIAGLRERLEFREAKLVDTGKFRYFADEAGKATGVPICPVCEKKGLHLVLAQDRSKGSGGVTYVCPSCKANYGYSGINARS
jgi:DNA-directed RNA polymerase subunit M/transcription elongation factor TFIIS